MFATPGTDVSYSPSGQGSAADWGRAGEFGAGGKMDEPSSAQTVCVTTV